MPTDNRSQMRKHMTSGWRMRDDCSTHHNTPHLNLTFNCNSNRNSNPNTLNPEHPNPDHLTLTTTGQPQSYGAWVQEPDDSASAS